MEEYIAYEGRKAAFEVSSHIVRSGNLLSKSMYRYLPWLKLIISIREPINRAISILAQLKELNQSGCLSGKSSLFDCLLHESQMGGVAPYGVRGMNYSFPMKDWLDSWPRNQAGSRSIVFLSEVFNNIYVLCFYCIFCIFCLCFSGICRMYASFCCL